MEKFKILYYATLAVTLNTVNSTKTRPLFVLLSCLSVSETMLSQGVKDRISTVVTVAKTAFHWGFMPTVLYLGFQKGADPGMPELTFASLLWA